MMTLMTSGQARAQQHAFFAERSVAKVRLWVRIPPECFACKFGLTDIGKLLITPRAGTLACNGRSCVQQWDTRDWRAIIRCSASTE